MKTHHDQRVGILVDVQNLYYSAKNLYGTRVNFDQLLSLSLNGRKLIRAISYVISADNTEEIKFFDFLKNVGFEVRQKELQTYWGGKSKGNWDVGIAVDAVKLAGKLDVIALVTGDGDFLPLVEYLQFQGVMVEVISFGKTSNSRLVNQADVFVDLDQYAGSVLLEIPKERKADSEND